MPNYDYECASCSKVFEIFQSMSDEPLKICPECGGEVKRLVGGGLGIIFKGSGFYVTDNKKSGSSSPSAGTPAAAAAASASGSSGSSSSAASSSGSSSNAATAAAGSSATSASASSPAGKK